MLKTLKHCATGHIIVSYSQIFSPPTLESCVFCKTTDCVKKIRRVTAAIDDVEKTFRDVNVCKRCKCKNCRQNIEYSITCVKCNETNCKSCWRMKSSDGEYSYMCPICDSDLLDDDNKIIMSKTFDFSSPMQL